MPAVEEPQPYEETVLRFKGKLKRRTLVRTSYAECLDDECDYAWTGGSSIVASGNHAVFTGHSVVQHYEATYQCEPVIPSLTGMIIEKVTDVNEVADKVRKLVKVSKTTESQRNKSKVTPKKD